MVPYRNAMRIDAAPSAEQLERAAQRLAQGAGSVLLGDTLALCRERGLLSCEVIDPAPATRRCAVEYEVLVENAQRTLEASGIADRLPELPRRWKVVELRGDGVVTAWRQRD